MNIDELKQDWQTIPVVASKSQPEAFQLPSGGSRYHNRLIFNNLIELFLQVSGLIVLALFLVLVDHNNLLPVWAKTTLVAFASGSLIPSILLYQKIHSTDPVLSLESYSKALIRRIKFFHWFHMLVNGFGTFLVAFPLFLISKGWKLTVDGEVFVGIINYPEPFFTRFVIAVVIFSAVFSVMGALYGHMMYLLFYQKSKKRLSDLLSDLEEAPEEKKG